MNPHHINAAIEPTQNHELSPRLEFGAAIAYCKMTGNAVFLTFDGKHHIFVSASETVEELCWELAQVRSGKFVEPVHDDPLFDPYEADFGGEGGGA